MIRRFRMVAGPNGSGKSTLMRRLIADYAVNFFDVLNADDIFAEVSDSRCYQPHISFDGDALTRYVAASSYDAATKRFFENREIRLDGDCVRFATSASVNSYTVALLTNFLQAESIHQGRSFSQETVFSHPSKIAALQSARAAGYRTYLYFVATDSPRINLERVALRACQGGHDVPPDKIESRFGRSLAQVPQALAFLSRAYFFDNSGELMRYIAQWNSEDGLRPVIAHTELPCWARMLFDCSEWRVCR